MQRRFARLLMLTLLAGCASGGAQIDPRARLGDPALYAILDAVPLDSAAAAALHDYEAAHPADFLEQVAIVAEDPNAGTDPRYNAVRILGEWQRRAALPSLRAAATDRDPRVRAAVVVAASAIATQTGEGWALVEAALADPAPEVAAMALERLGPGRVETVRAFVARQPNPELARIAREIIRVAEERGARLAADSGGVLRRQVSADVALEFRPTRAWARWDAAVGTVTIRRDGGPAVELDSIEVVRGVVPVFFSPDARHVVYERGRRIFVRALAEAAPRERGLGIAPRLLPFTGDFVFLRERPGTRTVAPASTTLHYDVVRAAIEGDGAGGVLGTIGAPVSQLRSGGYSPARWLRVVEHGDGFALEGEGFEHFALPPLFAPGDSR